MSQQHRAFFLIPSFLANPIPARSQQKRASASTAPGGAYPGSVLLSLCLPKHKVMPSLKNSMGGKGKRVFLCCLLSLQCS